VLTGGAAGAESRLLEAEVIMWNVLSKPKQEYIYVKSGIQQHGWPIKAVITERE